METMLRQGMEHARSRSEKAAWFNAYRDTVLTPEGVRWLKGVWSRDEKVEGLPLSETDEISMAEALAIREPETAQQILETQRGRIQDPDRKARFEFVMPALSADAGVRKAAFERLSKLENRRQESWVLESLLYLHHPLRDAEARKLLGPSLALLGEVQATGDIFFPRNWADIVLAYKRTPEEAAIVREYLARETKLPQRLRWIVLAAADNLMRASGATTGQ